MAHFAAPAVETELDEIWLHVATSSGSLETAHRVIDTITGRFFLLSKYPRIGRTRDHDLRPGLRSFPAGSM